MYGVCLMLMLATRPKVTFKLRELPPKHPVGPTALFVREYFETHPKSPDIESGKEFLVGAVNAYKALDAADKQVRATYRVPVCAPFLTILAALP